MKQYMTVGLAMLAGAALGAAAIQILHAQVKPPAVGIAEITIKDQDGYTKEFLPVIRKAIQAEGGKFIATGGETVSFTGSPPAPRPGAAWPTAADRALMKGGGIERVEQLTQSAEADLYLCRRHESIVDVWLSHDDPSQVAASHYPPTI